MRSNARLCVALLVSEADVDINRQRSAVGLCCLSKRLCVILYVKDCTVADRSRWISCSAPETSVGSYGSAPKALERLVSTSANLLSTNKSVLGLASVCLLSGRERVLPK